MKILFCNTTYLKYYDSITDGELVPKTGGSWVKENKDAHEKWNFLNFNGKCYGYVQGLSDTMHIERMEGVSNNDTVVDDAIIIWCANNGEKTVIVGWYENATIYRYLQNSIYTPVTGLDRCYWFETEAQNAYLLPESERTFEIKRASKNGSGTGFGQYNYWFADSEFAKKDIIPKVLDYINNHKYNRINTQTEFFFDDGIDTPFTDEEFRELQNLTDDQYKEYIKFGYRVFRNDPSADTAYYIAEALSKCHQYSLAIPWLEKTIEYDPEDLVTSMQLVDTYHQCNEFDKSINLANELLVKIGDNKAQRDEIYCAIADNYMRKNEIKIAIQWLDKIINVSDNLELVEYTKETKSTWANLL